MQKLFHTGDKFKVKYEPSKTGTVRYLRDDKYERDLNPRVFHYHVDFNDGSFETYFNEDNMELISRNPETVFATLKIGEYPIEYPDYGYTPHRPSSTEHEVIILNTHEYNGKKDYKIIFIDGIYKSYNAVEISEDNLIFKNDTDKNKLITKYKVGQQIYYRTLVKSLTVDPYECVKIIKINNGSYDIESISSAGKIYKDIPEAFLYEFKVDDFVSVSGQIYTGATCISPKTTNKVVGNQIGQIININFKDNTYCVEFIDKSNGEYGIDVPLCNLTLKSVDDFNQELINIINKESNDVFLDFINKKDSPLLKLSKKKLSDLLDLYLYSIDLTIASQKLNNLIKQLANISHEINKNYSNNYVIFKNTHDALIESIKKKL